MKITDPAIKAAVAKVRQRELERLSIMATTGYMHAQDYKQLKQLEAEVKDA